MYGYLNDPLEGQYLSFIPLLCLCVTSVVHHPGIGRVKDQALTSYFAKERKKRLANEHDDCFATFLAKLGINPVFSCCSCQIANLVHQRKEDLQLGGKKRQVNISVTAHKSRYLSDD